MSLVRGLSSGVVSGTRAHFGKYGVRRRGPRGSCGLRCCEQTKGKSKHTTNEMKYIQINIHTHFHRHIYLQTVKSTSTGLALNQCNHSPVTLFYDFASSSTCAATPECVRSDRTAT